MIITFLLGIFLCEILKLRLHDVVFRQLSNLTETAGEKKISSNSNPAKDLGTYRLVCSKLIS